jgi:hypothetical protein
MYMLRPVPMLEVTEIAARHKAAVMQDRYALADAFDVAQSVSGEKGQSRHPGPGGRFSSRSSWRPIGSSPEVGSSSRSTRGSLMSDWARPTFWIIPEEKELSRLSATAAKPNNSTSSSMRR